MSCLSGLSHAVQSLDHLLSSSEPKTCYFLHGFLCLGLTEFIVALSHEGHLCSDCNTVII